jgi:hypothetical protein
MPDLRFIERRDRVEVVERVGPFERGSDLFWREYGWQTRVAEIHNGGRPADSLSRQTVHVLDGNRREIKNAADI